MIEALASKSCTPCRGGVPPLLREQAEILLAQAPDWQLSDEAHHIERSFRFRNFREALTFVQEIGELIEGLSFPAYHRISTVIFVPAQSGSAVEMVTIEPVELHAAQEQDGQ
jgi:hypothetical protein